MVSIELIGLLLFLLQQFGIVIAVGASTFASMFYIVGLSDGIIDSSEKRFMHAVYATLRVGLLLILTTGVCITAAHYFAGQISILLAPSYIFKWLLLLVIILNAVLMDAKVLSAFNGGAIAGATWYTLFIIHTLSLSFSWAVLLSMYALWLIIFWIGFVILQKRAKALYIKEGAIPVPPSTLPRGPHLAEGGAKTS